MKNKISILITILVLIIASIILHKYEYHSQSIIHSTEHKKIRVLYYEGGPYYDYKTNLISLFEGLEKLNLVNSIDFSDFIKNKTSQNSQEVWDYVCDRLESEDLELHKEDFYSSYWEEDVRHKNKETILNRLKDPNNDINLVIAMGTWAGLDLVNNSHSVNTMVISCTDALKAGIIKKINDSRFPHVFVEYDPYIYYQQINLFHSIFDFKRLGVVYTDSEDGKTYVAYDDIMKLSEEKNFEVLTCTYNGYEKDINKLVEDGKRCVDELSSKCDAMYFGDQAFMKYNYLPYVIQSTIDNKIPTWSHHGLEHVRRGILMSKAHEYEFKKKGVWQANILYNIIHGATPYKIKSIWKDKTELVINIEVAKKIGFNIPESLLNVSHKVFTEIDGDK